MMSGNRPPPDPLVSLLGIVGDPKATAERIEQIQAATKRNEESLAALEAERAKLDARALELDAKEANIEKDSGKLDDREAALDAREKLVARAEKTVAELKEDAQKALTVEATTQLRKMEDIARREAELAERETLLQGKLDTIQEQAVVMAEDRDKLSKLQAELLARQADLDKRYNALKELVG